MPAWSAETIAAIKLAMTMATRSAIEIFLIVSAVLALVVLVLIVVVVLAFGSQEQVSLFISQALSPACLPTQRAVFD